METKNSYSVAKFFKKLMSGKIGNLEIDNFIQTATDNYKKDKLKKLLNDLEFHRFMKKDEIEGSFSIEEIELAIKELKEQGKVIPYIEGSNIVNKEKLLFPHDFFIVNGTIARIKELIENEPTPEPQPNQRRVIIQWNENSNVITDIFRQLKVIYNKEGEPVVGNSIPEMASFLKYNFSCFENTKLSTIETMLKGTNNPPKTSRRIIIEREKPQ